MKYPEDYINKIIQGDALTILKQLPDEIVNCVVTSPPYWGLRDYGIEPVIWDGVEGCEHEWISEIKEKEEFRNSGTGWLIGHNKGEKKAKVISRNVYPEYWEKKKIETQFCQTCGAWRGSLGLEPTFELYIKHLCDIFDEVKRVLRKDGTCFVNLGDSYNGSKTGNTNASTGAIDKPKYSGDFTKTFKKENQNNIPTKSLCLIPQRFEIEMVNRGWILRNTIIWHKPNCMPSSANDRFTVDFEYLFFFVKSKSYWFEQQFEDITSKWVKKYGDKGYQMKAIKNKNKFNVASFEFERHTNPQGRNKRSVWTMPTQPFPEAHFATFPEKLIETPIKAGCPQYVCKKCGKGRVKIYKKGDLVRSGKGHISYGYKGNSKHQKVEKSNISSWSQNFVKDNLIPGMSYEQKFIGYTDCGCNAGWEGGVVLDPFMGAGTTAVVAKKQGKKFIGIELKQEYIDMANKRLRKIAERLF